MDTKNFLKKRGVFILLGAAVILYFPVFARHPEGMTLYPLAAECLLKGQAIKEGAPAFTYLPVFAFFMIPFVPLPMWARNLLWYAILISSTFLAFRFCQRLVLNTFPRLLDERETRWLGWLSFVLSLKFIFAVFSNQAYDGIVFLCLLVGLEGEGKGKDLWACTGLALAAALKATPLVFFPYLLLRRRWRLFLGGVALYLGFSFLPDFFFTPQGTSAGYFVSWLQDIVGGAAKSTTLGSQGLWFEGSGNLNQSLRFLVYRIVETWGNPAGFNGILKGVYVVFLIFMAILLVRSARMRTPIALDSALLVIGMLMLSPMSSKSHFVALMLPYMVLSAYAIGETRLRKLGTVILASSFALTSLTSKDLVGRKVGEVFLSAGCVTIGTLILLVFLSYIVFTRNVQEEFMT
jgi:Arc/MetJ family transcription regulator